MLPALAYARRSWRVFGGADAYAIGGASPELVAAFLTAADGTTAGEYYRKASSATTFDGLFTFSRSGTATYFDSNGTLQTAADGVARRNAYYYNGSSWAKGGLQLESAAATNLEPYSNDFTSGGWGVSFTDSLTVTAGSGVGPDGNSSLSLVEITDTTNEGHVLKSTTAFAASTVYCISAFVRNDDQRYLGLWAFGDANHWAHVTFDLQTGAKTNTQTGATSGTVVGADIEDYGSGLYRIWMAFSVSSVAGVEQCGISFVSSGTPTLDTTGVEAYAGTAGVGCYFGFFDRIAGSFPQSHVPTSGSTVTRAAETLSIAGADTPANTTAMSISMKGLMTYEDDNASAARFWSQLRTSTAQIRVGLNSSTVRTGRVEFYFDSRADGGLNSIVLSGNNAYYPGINVPFSIAAYYQVGSFNGAVDGSSLTENTGQTVFADLTTADMQLGPIFNGFISELRMWDAKIGDTGIAEVTT